MRKRSIVAGAAAALLVVGTGGAAIGANLALLGTDRDASSVGQLEVVTARAQLDPAAVAADTSGGTTEPTASDAAPAATPSGITAEMAIAIAAAEVGGTFVEVEWTTERGRSVFEVEQRLADGTRVEVYVDAADGSVLEIEREGRLSDLADRARESIRGTSSASSPVAVIDAARAVEIAVAAVGGTLVEVERDREDGVDVYGVELRQADGRILDVHVDAVSGAVLRVEDEWRDDDDDGDDRDDWDDREDERAWSGVTDAISSDAAARIAREAVGGGDVVEVERDEHRGRAIWEVSLREGGRTTEVYVDAVSGEVLEIDIDD